MDVSQGTWNYSLDDTSPMFRYKPYSDGIGLSNGWQAWYSVSGFLSSPGEGPGLGTSYHITSLESATVELSFFGIGISLFGTANCTYDVILDGRQEPNANTPFNTLFSAFGLSNGQHNVTLVAQPSSENQVLQFDGAAITSPTPSSQQSDPSTTRIDNQNTSMISYQGNWTKRSNDKTPTRDNPSPYFLTTSDGASASMNFSGRAIEIKGISNYGWSDYLVTLDGENVSGLNASSFWIIPDAILFYQDGLDETANHTLSITNSAGNGWNLALNSFTVYKFDDSSLLASSSPLSPTPSPSQDPESDEGLSRGHTAGIVVAAFIGAAILAFVVFFVCVRKLMPQAGSRSISSLLRTEPYSASDPSSRILRTNEPARISSRNSTLTPPSDLPFSAERSDVDGHMLFGESLFATTDVASTYPRSPTMPSEYIQVQGITSRNTTHAGYSFHPAMELGSQRKNNIRLWHAQPENITGIGQTATAERIADVVVERLAGRLGPEMLNPPPSYNP